MDDWVTPNHPPKIFSKNFKKAIDNDPGSWYTIINLRKGDNRMLREYTIRGCVCHLSEETIAVYEENLRAIEDERSAWQAQHDAYLRACESNDPMDWSIYSDLYKDCYGVRPRH